MYLDTVHSVFQLGEYSLYGLVALDEGIQRVLRWWEQAQPIKNAFRSTGEHLLLEEGAISFYDGIIFDGPDCCPCSETGTSDERELMGVWGGKKTKLCFQKCPGRKVYKIGRLFCFPYQFF